MTSFGLVAIVPLRSPGAGKTRLAPQLSGAERAALAGAMLADVCAALATAMVDRIVVAAGGPAAAAAAAALDVEVVLDPPHVRGLNAAVSAATATVAPRQDTLIVTADLPWLRAGDVARLVAEDGDVIVAPTGDGGTGGLLRRAAGRSLGTRYGRGSAAAHVAAAREAGLAVRVIDLAGFRDDVDTWADVRRLGVSAPGDHTRSLVTRLLSGRLSSPPRTLVPPGDPDAAGHRQELQPGHLDRGAAGRHPR